MFVTVFMRKRLWLRNVVNVGNIHEVVCLLQAVFIGYGSAYPFQEPM
jgi:hypothetical protein